MEMMILAFIAIIIMVCIILFAKSPQQRDYESHWTFPEIKTPKKNVGSIDKSTPFDKVTDSKPDPKQESLNGFTLVNIKVPSKDNTHTVIDALVITQQGLFAVLNVNKNGSIYGNEKEKWVRVAKSSRTEFENPLKINASRIKQLHNYMKIFAPIISLIVFPNGALFQKVPKNTPNYTILYQSDIKRTVKNICALLPDIMTQDEMKALYNYLRPLSADN